jgi:protein involved in polysaccharide export with SLBB domain
LTNYKEGLYDFSDPTTVNIKVAVWGYVSRPGKYIIPNYATVSDLLSYAGGPERDAQLNDLRVYRIDKDGKEQMIKFNYNDLVWDDHLEVRNRVVPTLKPGDILIIPGSPKMFFADWFRLSLEIFSTLLSIISIILTIKYYNH